MNIGDYIKCRLLEKGASTVGFADLSSIPEEARQGYPNGIVIGMALDPGIVLGIKNGPTQEYYGEYKRLNARLDELVRYTEKLLKDNGYAAMAKSRDAVIEDEDTLRTALPHKTVATRAGIGWIGKCALLVTEEFGSALRISSVLTNAELDVGQPVSASRCGSCSTCRDVCPAGAVSGNAWEIGKDRDELYNAFECRRGARERAATVGIGDTICGLCIANCPWTRHYLEKSVSYTTGGLELLPQVEPLWYGLREHHSAISSNFSDSIRRRSFADRADDFLKNADYHTYRIELAKLGDSDRASGYCISSISNDLAGEVDSLFVDASCRGLGIGGQLMKSSLAWMDGKGAERKRISVMAGNDVLGFYERFGFKVRTFMLEQVDPDDSMEI